MIELEHSPLGGSGAERWFNCAGSFVLQRELLEAGELEVIESEYAILGTAAHELGARCLTERREPYEFIGQEIGGFIVGQDIDPDAVAIYVADCARMMGQPGDTVMIETTISRPDVHPHLKGTVDFGRWNSTRMSLRDYKNGEGVGVRAGGNKQLLYYGFIQALESGLTDRNIPVDLGIVQPNFYGIFTEPEVWETTLGNVLDFGFDELLPRMEALSAQRDLDDSDFVSGTHCQFCPVMLECPKLQRAFEAYAEGEEFIAMLSDEEVDRYYAMREDARRFMNALGDVVKARMLAGRPITSAKLVEKQTARVWKPGADAVLKATFGEKAYAPPKLLSPAGIEKLSSRGKELALEYGYKPGTDQLTIAPLSDPRPPAKPAGNAGVFKAFEQSPEELGW